jgi:hypothetical protein
MSGFLLALVIIGAAIVVAVIALILRLFLGRRRRPDQTPAEPADPAPPRKVSS